MALINLNAGIALTDSDIPPGITRDPEYQAADIAHANAGDPHPTYLTQAEGDARYGQLFAKILTGTTAATQGGSIGIAHGLNFSKIIGVSGSVQMVAGSPGLWLCTDYKTNAGGAFSVWFDATNVSVGNDSNNSGLILSKPFRLVIHYTA